MRSKYDKQFKIQILDTNLCKKVDIAKYRAFLCSDYYETFNNDGEIVFTTAINELMKIIKNDKSLECAFLLNESRKRKTKKVRDKITDLVLSGNAIFLTLTFNDKTLLKTSQETRRRYVARYLKDNCVKYVANIDFGAKNGREHYHALVPNDIDLSSWHQYGAIHCERVRTDDNDLKRISKYITKLTAHALKVCSNTRLIYSRDTI